MKSKIEVWYDSHDALWNITAELFSRQLNTNKRNWLLTKSKFHICLHKAIHVIIEIMFWDIKKKFVLKMRKKKLTFTRTLFTQFKNRAENRLLSEIVATATEVEPWKIYNLRTFIKCIYRKVNAEPKSNRYNVCVCSYFPFLLREKVVQQWFDVLLFKWTSIYSSIQIETNFFSSYFFFADKDGKYTHFPSSWISFE